MDLMLILLEDFLMKFFTLFHLRLSSIDLFQAQKKSKIHFGIKCLRIKETELYCAAEPKETILQLKIKASSKGMHTQ